MRASGGWWSNAKWGERPLAIIVPQRGQTVTASELRAHLAPRVARFWIPDGFVFVTEMPRTSTGKVLKSTLRERYRDGPAAI